jgi:uncharacterized membrane protein (UPF0127 family)
VRQTEVRTPEGRVVCRRCDVADGPLTRMRGLLGRSQLTDGQGLLLQPAGSVHTFFMRFPIDVVFLDRDGLVTRVVPALRPWRAAGSPKARAVLELPAGACAREQIAPGSRLEFDP